MKVAYIHISAKAYGGASKAFRTMLLGLVAKGVEPVVVLPSKGPLLDVLERDGIPCLVVPYRMNIYPSRENLKDRLLFLPRIFIHQSMNFLAVRKICRLLKNHEVNLIHTNVSVLDVGYRVSRKLKVPHVYHIREYADLDFNMCYFPSKSSFRRQLNAEHSYSICITKGIQEHHGQKDNPRSRVIYDGIRPAVTNPPSMASGDYLLFAGRIEPTKGLDVLLKAYAACHRQGCSLPPLRVAGRVAQQAYFEAMQRYVVEAGIAESVQFLGEQPDIEALMRQSRALIVPSRYEGFGLCMPEAMFCGCPVVAHDTAGTKEQLDNGLRLAGKDIAWRYTTVEQLAEHLKALIHPDGAGLNEMTRRAFDVVNHLYTAEEHVSQVCHFYKDILEHKV